MDDALAHTSARLPPGPAEKYRTADDLLLWMHANFARYGDLYRASVFGATVYVVGNPEHCERILRWNWRNYARSGLVVKRIALLLGNGLIASNGDIWASQRRMIQPALAKSAVGAFGPLMAQANAEVLHRWRQAAARGETVNVTHELSAMVLKITLLAIFGEDYAALAPHFGVLADEAARNLAFAQSFRPLGRMIVQVAERRRREGRPSGDLLGSMMQARDRTTGAAMPDAQLAQEAMTLVVAGHETTAALLNWIWFLLARYPAQQERLAAELDRLPWDGVPAMTALPRYAFTRQVIDEALRLYPPLWLMTRRALAEDRLGEFHVPAGTEIYISPYLVQRDPALWPAPDAFDPDRMAPEPAAARPELALCPFGAGPRNCIGEVFARVETQIHLMMFARELRLHHQGADPEVVATGMNLLSRNDFVMRPELRRPAIGS